MLAVTENASSSAFSLPWVLFNMVSIFLSRLGMQTDFSVGLDYALVGGFLSLVLRLAYKFIS
jgi:hypothetical protein